MNETPKRKEEFVVEEMDNDLLIADFAGEQLYTLNPTAAVIWEMCDGTNSKQEIATELARHFKIPVEQVQSDVDKTIHEFREKGLLAE